MQSNYSYYRLLLAILACFYFSCIISTSSNAAEADETDYNNRVRVKFINDTDYYIRVKIDEDVGIFGVGSVPVVYSQIPSDENTTITFQIVKNPSRIDRTLASSVASSATSIFKSANAIGSSVRAAAGATEAVAMTGTAKGILEFSENARRADPNLIGDFLVHDAIYGVSSTVDDAANIGNALKESVEIAQNAKLAMGLGVGAIGLSGIDWYLGTSKSKELSMDITPEHLDDFEQGKELLVQITEEEIFFHLREPPQDSNFIRCRIDNRSGKSIGCCYKDMHGDEVKFSLDPTHFTSGDFEVAETQPDVVIYEIDKHENSNTHHGIALSRGGMSLGMAAIDPFPPTKILSLISGLTDVYSSVYGLSENTLGGRLNLRFNSSSSNNVTINNNNSVSLGREEL